MLLLTGSLASRLRWGVGHRDDCGEWLGRGGGFHGETVSDATDMLVKT